MKYKIIALMISMTILVSVIYAKAYKRNTIDVEPSARTTLSNETSDGSSAEETEISSPELVITESESVTTTNSRTNNETTEATSKGKVETTTIHTTLATHTDQTMPSTTKPTSQVVSTTRPTTITTTVTTPTTTQVSTTNKPVTTTQKPYDINSDIQFAKSYAISKGFELDPTTTACWDNPIAAGPKCIYTQRDIKAYLDMYSRMGDVTDVWIWYEQVSQTEYNIYIGYA